MALLSDREENHLKFMKLKDASGHSILLSKIILGGAALGTRAGKEESFQILTGIWSGAATRLTPRAFTATGSRAGRRRASG